MDPERKDPTHKLREKVEALLREGLLSESREMTLEEWDAIRREGLERLKSRNREEKVG